jgi:hypothetical protein
MDSATAQGFSWGPWLRIGGAYFLHFASLGFASFPLQTHLRSIHSASVGSLIASVFPVAAILTYFFFRFAEERGWTRSPGKLLFGVAIAVMFMQSLLGLHLELAETRSSMFEPIFGTVLCVLLLGCSQSTCMTLLNHFGVSVMGPHAYSVRAAGSAGYMLAIVTLGILIPHYAFVGRYHLFFGAACALLHVTFVAWNLRTLRPAEVDPLLDTHDLTQAKPHQINGQEERGLSVHFQGIVWAGLIALVWLVAFCEMSYGLYSHEFLTTLYPVHGYYLFAGGIFLEIVLLIVLPHFPKVRSGLLFLGPLGWILLFSGCFLAQQGWWLFGLLSVSLALNCPFQISANETSHALRSSVLGVATMMLAQSLGYISATLFAAGIHYGDFAQPGRNLWDLQWTGAVLVAVIGLPLAVLVRGLAKRLKVSEPERCN